MDDEQILAASVGEPPPTYREVVLAEYDPEWPRLVRAGSRADPRRARRRGVGDPPRRLDLGAGAVAKPLIDIDLVVADTTDEERVRPEAGGGGLRPPRSRAGLVRAPDARGYDPPVNLHVFPPDCPEVERMLLFRDWLRTNDADRELYARTKRELASQEWKYVQNYADAKTAVVEQILKRATADPTA